MKEMITETRMLYLYVESPLHAGVGSGLSSIDLPIQRERTTQYPMIQGSGIKGKLRATIEGDRKNLAGDEQVKVDMLFGPSAEEGKGNEHAGALILGDARILLFPVRSLNGVFAYTTSYYALNRFKRDLERSTANGTLPWSVPDSVEGKALVTTTCQVQANDVMVLEEFSFDIQREQEVDEIAKWIAENALPANLGSYWSDKIKFSLVILPDDDFRDFALYATEIITRVRLDRDKKTVVNGALWTEEHLPSDTLLYVPVYATNARKNGRDESAVDILRIAKELGTRKGSYLQLGGDETVGRGVVQLQWWQ